MPVPPLLTNIPGGFDQVVPTQSGGAANAEKIVATTAAGLISDDLIPPDTGRTITTVGTSEALSARNFVNFHTVSGALRVRKADSATAKGAKRAEGFVQVDVAAPGTAKVYRSGPLGGFTGLEPGVDYYLGPAGTVTKTPTDVPGQTQQLIGRATSATEINVQIAPFVGIS